MKALLLSALLTAAPDAPTVTRTPEGSYVLTPQAWDTVDAEMKRLQRVEAQQPNVPVIVVISALVGVVIGGVAGASIAVAVSK